MLHCACYAVLYYAIPQVKGHPITIIASLHIYQSHVHAMSYLALLSSVRLVGLCRGGLFTAVRCKEFIKLLWTLTLLSTLGYFEFKMRI